MNPQNFDKFQDDFNAYGKLIKSNSIVGIQALKNIEAKKDYFNQLSADQKIEFMNTDPDFVSLQSIMKNLKSYYASFFDFVNQSLNEPTS